VWANIAAALDLQVRIRSDNDDDPNVGHGASTWMLLARHENDLLQMAEWDHAKTSPKVGLWTDDYANVWSVLRF
jgi:hypothetical protein